MTVVRDGDEATKRPSTAPGGRASATLITALPDDDPVAMAKENASAPTTPKGAAGAPRTPRPSLSKRPSSITGSRSRLNRQGTPDGRTPMARMGSTGNKLIRSGLLARPSLLSRAQPWWTPPPEVAKAANSFDTRHRAFTARAERVIKSMLHDNTGAARDRFALSLSELRWNRFFVDVPVVGTSNVRVAPRPLTSQTAAWKIEKSVWAPRKTTSDARGFYDDEAVYLRMFQHDWARANGRRLARFVATHDDDGDADLDEDGVLDELGEVEKTLWEHHHLIYNIFDFYASMGSSSDIFHINLNAYHLMIEECHLSVPKSAFCQKKHLDQLFVLVNSMRDAGDDRFNKDRALNRHEFMQLLIRLATARYVMSGKIPDISEGLHELFNADFDQRLDPIVLQDSNAFRREYCYREEVDSVFKNHAASLRALYNKYADARLAESDGVMQGLGRMSLVSFDEWMRMCRDLNLFDHEFNHRCGVLCFVWSRMRVIDESNTRSRTKMVHMSYVDFLEAIVRIATMKGMPTDREIEAAGCEDAGHYIHQLQARSGEAYKHFVDQHAQRWNEEPLQPIERCVEHLISLIVRTVEGSVSKKIDHKISDQEASRFFDAGAETSGEILRTSLANGRPAREKKTASIASTAVTPTAMRPGQQLLV